MIVKNEAAVIERCLRSVRPFIDAWAIADTGSSDGTQEIVRRVLQGIPGELIERPWVDFSTNRNQALELARRHGDYALIIDADEVLQADTGFAWPALAAPGYLLELVFGDTRSSPHCNAAPGRPAGNGAACCTRRCIQTMRPARSFCPGFASACSATAHAASNRRRKSSHAMPRCCAGR